LKAELFGRSETGRYEGEGSLPQGIRPCLMPAWIDAVFAYSSAAVSLTATKG